MKSSCWALEEYKEEYGSHKKEQVRYCLIICVIMPTAWGHPALVVFFISCKECARQWNQAQEHNKGKCLRYLASEMFACKILKEEQSLWMNWEGAGRGEWNCQHLSMLVTPTSFQSRFKVTPKHWKNAQATHLHPKSYELCISSLQKGQGAVRGRDPKSITALGLSLIPSHSKEIKR